MEGDIIKYFNDSAFALLRLAVLIEDSFFSKKLEARTSELTLAGVKFLSATRGDSLSQAIAFNRIIFLVDSLTEILKDMQYLRVIRIGAPQLVCQKHLLQLKLVLLKNKTILIKPSIIVATKKIEDVLLPEVINSTRETISTSKNAKMNKSKKMIFDYIKNFPNSRTKDIIHEFSAVSDRTVKRNLIDLTRSGLIKKRIDNKAVFYSVVNV